MSASIDPEELAAYLSFLEASNLLQQAVERQLRRAGGVSQAQFEILIQLNGVPEGQRMTDLAERLVVSRSGLTYQMTQLERAGLIRRSRPEDDERSVVAQITPRGRNLLQRLIPDHVALVRSIFLDRMDRTDLLALGALFGRIARTLRG